MFNRGEIRLILDGLDKVRQERKAELLQDGETNVMGCDEYASIVRTRDKLIELLERLAY
jgi:hypothetical protein